MQFDLDFDLPQKFIEVKRNQLHQNEKVGSFISKIYNNYNLKNATIRKSLPLKKLKRKYETQQMKRMRKVKTIMRQQNLNEKYLLDEMNNKQKFQIGRQKRKIQARILTGRDIEQKNDNIEFFDIINVQKDQNIEKKQKKVIYVNAGKMRYDKTAQNNQDCVEVMKSKQGNDFIPLEKSYEEMKAIYEHNKTIHEKDTYKFNVNWWENQQKAAKKNVQFQRNANQEAQQNNLDPEAMKSLKRQLKPLRRHKLISTRYAPLSQFMPDCMFQKDGIKDGRLIDSSQSQDEAGRFEYYDNMLNQMYNPPGLIELDQQKNKRKRKSKKTDLQKPQQSNKCNVAFDLKTRQDVCSDEPVVQKRLKRALIRMKNKDWKEDKLFTKGMDEDKPIQIDDME